MLKEIENEVLEKYGEVKPVKLESKNLEKEMVAITFGSMASTVGLGPSKVEFYYAEKNNCILKIYQWTIDEIQVINKKENLLVTDESNFIIL